MLSDLIHTLLIAVVVIWTYMSIWFVVALVIKRNDVADIAWGLGFVVTSVSALLINKNYSFTALLVAGLVLLWGLRLSWHITRRNIKKSEDYRYKAWRDSWGKWFVPRSYLQIFLLQGLLMLLILSPVIVIVTNTSNNAPVLTLLGTAIWIFGFLFESIGDKQLKSFIADSKNKGHVMTKGLWQYTRHPNYFGEITQWWGIGLIALAFDFGWLGLVGPLVITFLIVKVSGVPLLENKYADNPEYQAYKKRTSMLVPLPVKKG